MSYNPTKTHHAGIFFVIHCGNMTLLKEKAEIYSGQSFSLPLCGSISISRANGSHGSYGVET